jgi:glycosyltransferase involved in cell wall biosynthesis
MRILHCILSINPAGGGPVEGIRQLSSIFTKANHQLEVASLDAPESQFLSSFPVPVHPLGPARLKYGYSKRFKEWLRQNVGRFDIVVVNGIWGYNSFAVWQTLRNSAIPYVVFTHGMLDPWFKNEYPLKHLKKCLYWPFAEYWVLRQASAVLFTSDDERLLARKSFRPYRVNEQVVTYGTGGPKDDQETKDHIFFNQFPELKGKQLLLCVGRIHPKKGCDLAIRAFAQILASDASWHLVMAGPDQVGWKSDLNVLAKELNIHDRITWTGMIAGKLKWSAFGASDVFLLPSHQENFGIVVAEALACGVPTLITDKVNIWREVHSAGAGLIAADDLNGVCSLLEQWVAMSSEEKTAMRARARQCFEAKFTVQESTKSLLRIYTAVTAVPEPAVLEPKSRRA